MNKILVVEDNPNQRKLVVDILQLKDFSVQAVATGKEALNVIRHDVPVVAIVDLRLGNGNGLEVIREIKKHCNTIACIVLTAHGSHASAVEAINLGAYAYIQKPYDVEQLLVTVQRAVERHETEEELRQSEERFRVMFEASHDLLSISDQSGKILWANPAWTDTLGVAPESQGDTWQNIHPDDKDLVAKVFKKMEKDELAFTNVKYRYKTAGGDYVHLEATSRRRVVAGKPVIYVAAHDISEHKQAEAELSKASEQLRELAAHLESVREEERINIAREIHDDLGQTLTALKMDLVWYSKKIPEGQKDSHDKVKTMVKLVDDAIRSVQRLVMELRPGLLDDLGISAAVEWQIEEFQKRTGIRCELHMNPLKIILDIKRSTALYRVFQEVLMNVARHSGATEVKVSLEEEAEAVALTVKDNGCGISREEIYNPRSFGLIGIFERVNFLGGKADIRGLKEKGTIVEVTIPLSSY